MSARPLDRQLALLADRWWALPSSVRWVIWIAAAFLVLLARRPSTLLQAQFLNEDGQVFFIGTYFGNPLETIVRPYAGYLHFVPRVVALLERLVPIAWAPFVGNSLALLLTACIAAYLASDRMADAIPDRRLRWAIAGVFLLLPNSGESLGSITYAPWYLGIYIFAASLATAPVTQTQRILDRASLIAAGLTGPLSVLFAPLWWLRVWRRRDRDSWWAAGCVTLPAAVQGLIYLFTAPAARHTIPSFADALQVAATRMVAVPLVGAQWELALVKLHLPLWLGIVGAVALVAMLLWVGTMLPRWAAFWLVYGWAVTGLAGMWRSTEFQFTSLLDPQVAERYFVVPAVFVAVAVVAVFGLARGRRRWPTLILATLLTMAVVGDFELLPWTPHDWARDSACIGGPAPCVVPVAGINWDIHWPGRDGTYVQPTGL